MPSLEQLRNFKASFGNIADEAMVLSQLEVPPDDLPLPNSEPTAPPPPGEPPSPLEAPSPDAPVPEAPAEEESGLDMDFSDLFGGDPVHLTPPPAADTAIDEALAEPSEEAPPGDVPAAVNTAPDLPDLGDFDLDNDFPDFGGNAGADGEAASADTGDTGGEAPFPDFGDLDLDAGFPEEGDDTDVMGDLLGGLADEIEAERASAPEGPDAVPEDGADASDEASSVDIGETSDEPSFPDLGDIGSDLPDLGDLDLGADFPDFGTDAGAAGEDLDGDAGDEGLFPDLGDLGLDAGFPAEGGAAGLAPDSAAEGDFGMDLSPEGLADDDPFNNFSPDGEDTGPGDGGSSEADFALPGFDDFFHGASPSPGEEAGSADLMDDDLEMVEAEDTVEEIRLDDDEFDRLQKTLSSYPLNLRIAVEEIIAEQVVAPNLLSSLVTLLVRGGPAREAAALAAKILGKPIPIPRGFEKKTGEELEAEQASFPYVFVHKFLPVLRLFLVIALVAVSVLYLGYTFIYTPLRANSIYRQGYALIPTGSYAQANDRFGRAFQLHRRKDWFYRYAEAFRDERQYIYAEEKYDQLLNHYPGDKKGALDYADMETNYLRNYAKADRIIRRNVLDYSTDDKEGLLALGDNNLTWGEIDPSRYEEARSAYARYLEKYGWQDPVLERMLRYFIRVDNLGQVLPLQQRFMADPRRKISADTLAELGGYLLDKRFEEVRGVPNEHVGEIGGIRDILLRAVQAAPRLPEAHYHLARYYNGFGSSLEERQTLEIASRAFDIAPEESTRRTRYRLDTQRRLGEMLTDSREFFAAGEALLKGIGIYEDALDRRFLARDPQFGRLYADLGDLEYFTRSGDMAQALEYYLKAEQNGWAPPEMQYRIGSAYYQQGQWAPALDRFFAVSSATVPNRRLLNALGNVSYMRGNYFAAQGYYNRLMDLLDAERARFPMLMPNDRPEHLELAERMMVVRNNLGVTLEALTKATGNRSYRSRALGLYAESARAWDSLTRNPATMLRAGAGDLGAPGMNLAYLNSRNALYPESGYEPQLYVQIDKDVLEPSVWEDLVPQDFRLTDVVEPYLPR